VLLVAGRAEAYRPFDQTDADVAELHVMELELGPTQFLRSEGRTYLAPTFIFNYGVFPRWELVIDGSASGVIAGPREPSDIAQLEVGVALKGVLHEGSLQDGQGPSIAIEPELLLPATAGPSGFGFAAGAIVSQRWPALTVHLNLVPFWSRAHRFGGSAGVIIEGPSSWVIRPVGETYVQVERGTSPSGSGLLGLIWRISQRVSADAAFRVATVQGVEALEVRFGLTWDIPL
jgi:hypothetical protein